MQTTRQNHADALTAIADYAMQHCPEPARRELIALFGRATQTAGAVFEQLQQAMDSYHEARVDAAGYMKLQTALLQRLVDQGDAAAHDRNPLARRTARAEVGGLPG